MQKANSHITLEIMEKRLQCHTMDKDGVSCFCSAKSIRVRIDVSTMQPALIEAETQPLVAWTAIAYEDIGEAAHENEPGTRCAQPSRYDNRANTQID